MQMTSNGENGKVIHQYIMDKVGGRRQKVGIMVGMLDDKGRVKIGWSRTNINAGDKFDKQRGMNMSIARSNAKTNVKAPMSIKGHLEMFAKRCNKYFADNNGIYSNWW